MIHLLAIKPLHDAVNVKAMRALSPDEWAVVTREFAVRTTAIEGHSTNAAVVVVGYPLPHSHPGPVLDLHLHSDQSVHRVQLVSTSKA